MLSHQPSVSGPGHTMPGAPPAAHQPMTSMERIGFRYGLFTGAAFIGFFLLMKVLGLHERTEVAYVNGAFLVAGIFLALRYYQHVMHGRNNYLPGIGIGFLVSAVASVVLGLFFVLYSSIDREFAAHVQTANLYGMNLSVLMIFLVIVLQGTVGGTIVGYILMQFFKRPDHRLDDPRSL